MQEDKVLTQWCFAWCFPDVPLLGRAKWMGRGWAGGEARRKGGETLLLSCCPRHRLSFCSQLLGGGEKAHFQALG